MSHHVVDSIAFRLRVSPRDFKSRLSSEWRWVRLTEPADGIAMFARGAYPTVGLVFHSQGRLLPPQDVPPLQAHPVMEVVEVGVPIGYWNSNGELEWSLDEQESVSLLIAPSPMHFLTELSEAVNEYAGKKWLYLCQSCREEKTNEFMSSADRCLACVRQMEREGWE